MYDPLNATASWPAHGTRRRYRLELRHYGRACHACTDANARYQRGYRAVQQTDPVAVPWQQLELGV